MSDTSYMGYVGKEISPEQFVAEHTFVYILKGIMNTYDGSKYDVLTAGDGCIARKNSLARYNKIRINNEIEKVFIFFDAAFLRRFQDKYPTTIVDFDSEDTLIKIHKNDLLPSYIQSLLPHYYRTKISEPFTDVKREELLLILLQSQPELAGLFFDFGIPQKINIEEFMNRNFKFNVSLERFAFLTGRSLSTFKRDFTKIFGSTPSSWLIQKRLSEAYFLIEKKKQKPSEIYLDLGFETLQHFSFAFKKQFDITPTQLLKK